MDETNYGATLDDLKRAAELGGIDLTVFDEDDADFQIIDGDLSDADDLDLDLDLDVDVDGLLQEMAEAAFSPDDDAFAEFAAQNRDRIRDAAFLSDEVPEMLVIGYEMGVSRGNAACMNDLGALYYMGELVEQDYARAADLYEMAMNHGCHQSIINLGYIWEYGRTGTRDYQKAYEYYALATVLAESSEATYKLGDMYSRGKSVSRDMAKACQLWSRSLELAQGVVEVAQPAIRIAQLLMSDDCAEAGLEPDPLRALSLFQQAEVGLRIDIADGQEYYRKRLVEAIEGQQQARAMIEAGM